MQGAKHRLRDGRLIGFAEWGEPSGRPLVWFPGTPGSRLSRPMDDGIASDLGLRIVSIERPGFGWSSPSPGRTLLDWPQDTQQVLDALGIDRFHLIGFSGGGPYVAACAHALPDRVVRACIVGGMGPFDARGATDGMSARRRLAFQLARKAPALLRSTLGLTLRDPERLFRSMIRDFPSCDLEIVERTEIWRRHMTQLEEAVRPGLDGFVDELRLVVAPWGFSPRDIEVPVDLWYGTLDVAAPPSMGRHLADTIPQARAWFVRDEGHLLHFDAARLREILYALFEDRGRPASMASHR